MRIFNEKCPWRKRLANNAYGEPTFSILTMIDCAIIRSKQAADTTSPRAELSGSRSNAEEFTGDVQLLVSRDDISVGDRVDVDNSAFRVKARSVKRDVHGKVEFIRLDCDQWDEYA